MTDAKPHVLTIEESDYYGPDLKLELDCGKQPLAYISMSASIYGVESSVHMSLGCDQAEEVIVALRGFIDRNKAWKEEIRSRGQ
jgi:hypothetical protein